MPTAKTVFTLPQHYRRQRKGNFEQSTRAYNFKNCTQRRAGTSLNTAPARRFWACKMMSAQKSTQRKCLLRSYTVVNLALTLSLDVAHEPLKNSLFALRGVEAWLADANFAAAAILGTVVGTTKGTFKKPSFIQRQIHTADKNPLQTHKNKPQAKKSARSIRSDTKQVYQSVSRHDGLKYRPVNIADVLFAGSCLTENNLKQITF